MKGEQLNGLMAYSAKYFFNIDEYILAQFLLFLTLTATTFWQHLSVDLKSLKETIAQKWKKSGDTSFYDLGL